MVSFKFVLRFALEIIQLIVVIAVELLMYVEAVGEITIVLVLHGDW